MVKSIEIVKSLLIPKLEKDIFFQRIKFKDAFWETFILSFLNYENDAKPTYELIYALQLNDSEKIFDKLPNIYSKLVKELAENYVLGNHDNATNHLFQSKNKTFLAHVSFLQAMQQGIKKVERQNIKSNLPKSYERLTFELSDNEMTNAAKKIGREELRVKFKNWDNELKPENERFVLYSLGNEKKMELQQKVISLAWVKYAVAACLVLASGIWIFRYSNSDIVPSDNGVVTKEKDTTTVSPKIIESPVEAVAYETNIKKKYVQYQSELGFTNTTKSKVVTIYLKDASRSITKLENELTNELTGAAGDGPKYKALKRQLELLLSQQGNYEFDGSRLIIYTKDLKLSCSVLSIDNKVYYLKIDSNYYHLYFTKLPLKFTLLKDQKLIEQLEKTSFENEE